jgi:hypothetical protein
MVLVLVVSTLENEINGNLLVKSAKAKVQDFQRLGVLKKIKIFMSY